MKRLVFLTLSLVLLLVLIPGCITVQSPVGQPSVIGSFSSSPSAINPGGSSTLSWNVTGANSVSIDQGIGQVNVSGSMLVSPSTSTIYTISATNAAGTVTRSSVTTVINSAALPQIINGAMSVTLPSLSAESGSIIKSGMQDTAPSHYNITMNTACIGDDSGNNESRAFLSFDISSIPRTAVIQEAILNLGSYTKTGDPSYQTTYGGMGAMKVYHHQYDKLPDTTSTTSFSWWNNTAKLTKNGSFINYPLSPWAWDVKNSEAGDSVIQTLVQTGQTRSQFMMQFFSSTDWDSVTDMLCFSNVTLTIKYTMP